MIQEFWEWKEFSLSIEVIKGDRLLFIFIL
jgi:hypothetical protein